MKYKESISLPRRGNWNDNFYWIVPFWYAVSYPKIFQIPLLFCSFYLYKKETEHNQKPKQCLQIDLKWKTDPIIYF